MPAPDCPHCGCVAISRIAARCPDCGAERSHRDCYPEQYRHPLVGKHVKVRTRTGFETAGVVDRVVSTRFGLLAHLNTSGDTAYLVTDCTEIDPRPRKPRKSPSRS